MCTDAGVLMAYVYAEVELEDVDGEYVRSEGDKLIFRDKSSMEELEVDVDLVGVNLVPYLTEGHSYKVI